MACLKLWACFCRPRRPSDEPERPPPIAKVADDTPRRFNWSEIQAITGNFTSAVVGEGGFSTVFFARVSDSSSAAVKLFRSSERLNRAFRLELDVLLRLHHPHIVRLLGFCDEREEGVLVFEFVSNGTLHEKLHGGDAKNMSWPRRMSILYHLAEALDYLHDGSDVQIVHSDIKSSNVLLDEQFDPKLCDFGFARVGFSAAVAATKPVVMGSPGYIDPHYLRTGIVSKKCDMYSFGVLVLEMITGSEAFCSESEVRLTARVAPILEDGATLKLEELVDPRLEGEYDAGEAAALAELAKQCVGAQPTLRPSMKEVMRLMRDKVPSSVISAVGGKSNGR